MASAAALRVDWRETMDREANYVAVGAFVLLALVLGAGFVLWYTNLADGREERRYEIYFEGSVSGLSEGGSGALSRRVRRARVAHRHRSAQSPRACAWSSTFRRTRRSRATPSRASALQGVTGLVSLNLEPRDPASLPPPQVESLKYPVIPSQQSQFAELVSSLPEIVAKAGEALNRINAMLSDKNIAAAAATVASCGEGERRAADGGRRSARDVPGAARCRHRDPVDRGGAA